MREATRLFSALSDENRLRLVFALRHGELCVCQLIALLGLAPSTVSKHLSILRDAGLLDARKEGRWVYYRLAGRPKVPILGKQVAKIFQSLERSPLIRSDDRQLEKICKENMDALCRRQARRAS
ncbi:MAG TPA: metalloregulator ArsR/SmtB family transcription factor [Kiritimatiellia bacterium]|nr:metalloregulator ArsR/SmtB family transcription factor [Kiritimatiellia bacterium]HMO98544.1 metalloregulator ArsR/SmtB family transcription factor [Kiritimatiellia bacterium]HMP96970.1 metalloregulator ArsR/SmtB family transcription factor [Kiritimatiellia bacterium]